MFSQFKRGKRSDRGLCGGPPVEMFSSNSWSHRRGFSLKRLWVVFESSDVEEAAVFEEPVAR